MAAWPGLPRAPATTRHGIGATGAAPRRVGRLSRQVAVGEFRRRATELVRQVEETKQAITITRRGVPVAELRAVTVDAETLLGSVA